MENKLHQNEVVEAMLRELAMRLRNTKGKKVYGYLSTPARNLVNGIIDVVNCSA